MPGPHRKMVTQEESATVIEGEGEGVAREAGRAETGRRVDGDVLGAPGVGSSLRHSDCYQYCAVELMSS